MLKSIKNALENQAKIDAKSMLKSIKRLMKCSDNFYNDFLKFWGGIWAPKSMPKSMKTCIKKLTDFWKVLFMKNKAKMDAQESPKPSQNTSKKRRAFLIHFVRNRRIFPDGLRGADLQKFVQKSIKISWVFER